MDTTFYFSGPFAPMCELFVSQKRATGCKYEQQAKLLRMFDNFSKNYPVNDFVITEELALAWSKKRPNEAEITRYGKIGEMQRFANFLVAQGYPSYLPPLHLKPQRLHVPYIFTHEEMRRIFNYLDNLKPTSASPVMHLSIPLLIRMLYGCGLRISEAIALRMADVDLERGVLHIRHGKNERERLVPMSGSLTAICQNYATQALFGMKGNVPFFYNRRKEPYSKNDFGKRFRSILWDVGIPYYGKERGPSLHDLRHTFACHRLNKWVEEDTDINAMLPVLAAYLGHSSITGTHYYLRLTAEVYPHIISKIEVKLGSIFPQLTDLQGGLEDE